MLAIIFLPCSKTFCFPIRSQLPHYSPAAPRDATTTENIQLHPLRKSPIQYNFTVLLRGHLTSS